MFMEINIPPVIEQIVQPVTKASRGSPLDMDDYGREGFSQKKNKKREKEKKPGADFLLEPFVGLLFDHNA